ncbi:MAG TPA: hypothetical protein VND40_01595 [Nitrososphaerales archaeon]|nr:hypothetical protein [Nitrososphaerales archaeon]
MTALVVLALDIASSMSLYWFAGGTFSLLLALSGVALSFDFISKRMKPSVGGKVLAALVLIGVVLLFFAPAIQTLPSGTSSGSTCNFSGCSSVTQIESVGDYLWCVGSEYSYSLPPVTEFFFQLYVGCLPNV